jgi:hypothetical protein
LQAQGILFSAGLTPQMFITATIFYSSPDVIRKEVQHSLGAGGY